MKRYYVRTIHISLIIVHHAYGNDRYIGLLTTIIIAITDTFIFVLIFQSKSKSKHFR